MIELLFIVIVVALLLAAIDHFLFPIPRLVWFILAAVVVFAFVVLLFGAVDDAHVGGGR